MARHGDYGEDYGENDEAMRWLRANDPDAATPGYAKRHGLIGQAEARQLRRKEVSLSYIEELEDSAARSIA